MEHNPRHGAKQPQRFDPAAASRLDDLERFRYLPPTEVLALLDLRPGDLVLDFGAGTGTYAVEVARVRPDIRMIALEEQPAMLERLREKLAGAGLANLQAVDPGGVGPYAGGIDRILALNVLHELGDAALRELHALLKAGGRAVFIDWNADAERTVGPPRDHVYGIGEARQRLAATGFYVTGENLFPYHYALTAECGPAM